jgi:hypothetical protein
MKYYFLAAATAVICMSSCKQNEFSDTKRERDSLLSIVNERDSFINGFITSLNEVENNLDSVAHKQHIIAVNTTPGNELHSTQKSRINDEIASINNLMDQNRKTIAELNHRIKNSSAKNLKLEKLIATLNQQITAKDVELKDLNIKLSGLNAQVATLNISIDTLSIRNGVQSQKITDATIALHTAYYVVGKSNELKDAKIIDRKGGLLGIGKTSRLNSDFDNSKFTRIDYTTILSIPIGSNMNIITSHPTNSYTLVKDVKNKNKIINILIKDPESFWSTSKYLVVVKD